MENDIILPESIRFNGSQTIHLKDCKTLVDYRDYIQIAKDLMLVRYSESIIA